MRSGLWWLKGADQACGALFRALSLFAKRPLHPVIKDYDPGFMVYIPSKEWAAIHVVWMVQPQAMGLSLSFFCPPFCLERPAWLASKKHYNYENLKKASAKDLRRILFSFVVYGICEDIYSLHACLVLFPPSSLFFFHAHFSPVSGWCICKRQHLSFLLVFKFLCFHRLPQKSSRQASTG